MAWDYPLPVVIRFPLQFIRSISTVAREYCIIRQMALKFYVVGRHVPRRASAAAGAGAGISCYYRRKLLSLSKETRCSRATPGLFIRVYNSRRDTEHAGS